MYLDINDYNKLKLRKQRFLLLYNEFIKNRNCNLEDFLSNIQMSIGVKNISVSKLSIYLLKNKTAFCVSKAELMMDILNYVSSNEKNKELKGKIENIISKNTNLKKHELDTRSTKLHNEKMDNLLSNINILINEKRSYNELLKDKVIDDEYLLSNVNRFVCEIDDETYIKFLISYKRLERLSINELNQLKDTIDFFVINVRKKLDLLNSCNPSEDEIKIRNIKVLGEEKLSPYYADNIIRLYKWKIKKITTKLDFYVKFNEMISQIINTKDFDNIKKITYDKKIIEEDEDFIDEYYQDIQNIYNSFVQLKKMNYVNSDRNKVLCKMFNKSLISENN